MEVDMVDSDDESAKEEKEENRLRKSELELSKLGSGKSIASNQLGISKIDF